MTVTLETIHEDISTRIVKKARLVGETGFELLLINYPYLYL